MHIISVVCAVTLILACQVNARPQEAAAAAAAPSPPAGDKGNVTFVKNEVKPLDGTGAYSYDIELSDGTKLMQSGHTEAPGMGETEPSLIIEGSYSYTAPDGKQISITYVADKNGFQPKGDSIPTQGSASGGPAAPPAPAAAVTSTSGASTAAPPPAAPAPAQTAAASPPAAAQPAADAAPAPETP